MALSEKNRFFLCSNLNLTYRGTNKIHCINCKVHILVKFMARKLNKYGFTSKKHAKNLINNYTAFCNVWVEVVSCKGPKQCEGELLRKLLGLYLLLLPH